MDRRRVATITASILLTASAHAANPFLDAPDDKPVTAKFRGAEWGDNISEEEVPLTAQVVTTRMAKMSWGAIFKIEFVDVKSRAPEPRKIEPEYFVATDERILLVNEENIPAAIKRISAAEKPPEFEPGEIYAITSGSFNHEDGLWKTTIFAFTTRAILPVISKRSFGKKELDWLSTRAVTVRGPMATDSNVRQ